MHIDGPVEEGHADASFSTAAQHALASRIFRATKDVCLAALLPAAIAAVHHFDLKREPLSTDVVAVGLQSSEITRALEEANPVRSDRREMSEDALSSDAEEHAHPEGSEEEKATPTPSAGIIAGFVPFTPELPASRDQDKRDLLQPPAPSPADHVDTAQPAVLETPPRKIEFFETETKATSVGFVVDCSSSMDGAKFDAVRAELAKSITQLKADQRFFVVFFSTSFFPMTGNAQQPQLVNADTNHKQQILTFLQSATSGGGTNPEPALEFMTGLHPDVIYLLTDGEFSPLKPETYSQFATAKVVVHTIGFETGYAVPVLEEIARRTGGTYRSAGIGGRTPNLFLADPVAIRAALKDPDPAVRREAVIVAIIRQLPSVDDLIEMLADTDDTVRQAVHEELCKLAEGSDFGPSGVEDMDAAAKRWSRWWELRNSKRDTLIPILSADDPDEVWIAASLIRSGRVNVPDACIAAMRSAPAPVWQELRAAIRHSCPDKDFGPPDGASAEQVTESADRWAAWRTEERERVARELLAKRKKYAAEKLRLTKQLIDVNPTAVERRCRELIRDYADTPAAVEAKALLDELDTESGEE